MPPSRRHNFNLFHFKIGGKNVLTGLYAYYRSLIQQCLMHRQSIRLHLVLHSTTSDLLISHALLMDNCSASHCTVVSQLRVVVAHLGFCIQPNKHSPRSNSPEMAVNTFRLSVCGYSISVGEQCMKQHRLLKLAARICSCFAI